MSIGNSAGTLTGAAHRGDVVRPGIGLYGGNPFTERPNPIEPVVTLDAPIVQIRDVEQAQTVGYGATYGVAPPARLAIVALGYADGYPRALGNRGVVAIAGRRAPVVGRVSMDLLCCDVTALPPDVVARRRAGRGARPERAARRGRGRGRHDQLRDPHAAQPAPEARVSRRVSRSLRVRYDVPRRSRRP